LLSRGTRPMRKFALEVATAERRGRAGQISTSHGATAGLRRMTSYFAGECRTQGSPEGQGHACAHRRGRLSF
jgi:hypothetical protein